jgi:hypothetical protein
MNSKIISREHVLENSLLISNPSPTVQTCTVGVPNVKMVGMA